MTPAKQRRSEMQDFFAEFDNCVRKVDARAKGPQAMLHFFSEMEKFQKLAPHPTPALKRPDLNIPALRTFMEQLGQGLRHSWESGLFMNVWSIAGVGRSELQNASVAAWLLDATQSHGRGPAFFTGLIDILKEGHPGPFPVDTSLSSTYCVRTEHHPLGDRNNRVDIVVEGNEFVVFIEVKIDAAEGERQIERYLELARAKASLQRGRTYCVIFLSPYSYEPSDPNVVAATWSDLAKAIEREIGRPSRFGDHILWQFARHIRSF
jgi:hypothetical protein